MTDYRFSLSLFTIEVNGTPTVALQAKRHRDAERLCEHDRLRTKLSTLTSHGIPLCDTSATMKVRLATTEEAVHYRQATQSTEPSSAISLLRMTRLPSDHTAPAPTGRPRRTGAAWRCCPRDRQSNHRFI
jgi:hypothetical protein